MIGLVLLAGLIVAIKKLPREDSARLVKRGVPAAEVKPDQKKVGEAVGKMRTDLSGEKKLFETDCRQPAPNFRPGGGGLFKVSFGAGGLSAERVQDGYHGGRATTLVRLSEFPVTNFAFEVRIRFALDVPAVLALRIDESNMDQINIWSPAENRGAGTHLLVLGQDGPEDLLHPVGQNNSLLLVVQNREATGYVNGERVGRTIRLNEETKLPSTVSIIAGGVGGARMEIDHVTLWELSPAVSIFDTGLLSPPSQ
jgi:hypothetical protein